MSLNSDVLSNNQRNKSSSSKGAINSDVNVGGIERLACALAGGAVEDRHSSLSFLNRVLRNQRTKGGSNETETSK